MVSTPDTPIFSISQAKRAYSKYLYTLRYPEKVKIASRNRVFKWRTGLKRPTNPGIVFCEICRKEAILVPDHKDSLIRGWLCAPCNYYLGWFEAQEKNILAYLNRAKLDI